jgi:nucleotide-binding universal stress UspA family protein
VAIVRRRHLHEGVGPHRWIVAVLTESPDAHAVLHTAMDEAQLRHASILALTPWGRRSEPDGSDVRAKLDRYLADADDDDADFQICALPRPDNMLNLLAQSADVDQLVVASADDSRLLAELVGPPIRAVLKGTNCSVIFLRDGGIDSSGTKPLEE